MGRGHLKSIAMRTVLKIGVVSVFGLVISYVVISASVMPNQKATLYVAEDVCKNVGICLREYYEEPDVTRRKPNSSDAVEFLKNGIGNLSVLISSEAPTAPYDSDFDFSVYLLLPERLEGTSPVLVAYTSPIKRGRDRSFRIGLFLREDDAVALPLKRHVLEKIVGEKRMGQTEPDFYYWHNRIGYLDKAQQPDSKDKPERGTNEK